MKKLVFVFAFGLLMGAVTFGQDVRALESQGYTLQQSRGFVFGYKVVGENLQGYMSGPTTGWVAVGFDPSRRMRDANFVFGLVQNARGVLRDDYGTSDTTHASDESLGGVHNVTMLSSSEEGGRTSFEFEIPLQSTDRFDRPLVRGRTYTVIWAFGPNNRDDFTTIHSRYGSFRMNL